MYEIHGEGKLRHSQFSPYTNHWVGGNERPIQFQLGTGNRVILRLIIVCFYILEVMVWQYQLYPNPSEGCYGFLLIVNFRNQYTFTKFSDFSFLYFLFCIEPSFMYILIDTSENKKIKISFELKRRGAQKGYSGAIGYLYIPYLVSHCVSYKQMIHYLIKYHEVIILVFIYYK